MPPAKINGMIVKVVGGIVAALVVTAAIVAFTWGYNNERAQAAHNIAPAAHPVTAEKLDDLEKDVAQVQNDVRDIKTQQLEQRIILERIDHKVHDDQ